MSQAPTREQLAASYARSLSMPITDQVEALTALQFAGAFENAAEWAVGPFELVPELTFRPVAWDDPTGIGWEGTALFNPTLYPDGERLHLFYRSSPRKETLDSRIGHAIFDSATGRWSDDPANPIVFPTLANEEWGCEDPKLLRGPDGFHLFYNGAWPVAPGQREAYGSELFSGDVGCDINAMFSADLVHWRKLGSVVPHEVSRLWAKAAVIPRDGRGAAVAIGGEYLMFLSEGCGGLLTVGRSRDLRSWDFEAIPYLDIAELGELHEVSTALVLPGGRRFVLDFFYSDRSGAYRAGQALYDLERPFEQVALSPAGVLAWGGIVEWEGSWLFAQGWDAPAGVRELYFYRAR